MYPTIIPGSIGHPLPFKDAAAPTASADFIRKGLTLIGSWHLNLNDREAIYSILRHSPVVSKLITDVFALNQAQAAFEHFMSFDTCKVILKPWL